MADHLEHEQLQPPLIPEGDPHVIPTAIWECEANDCKGWMRKSFSLESAPDCPLCKSSMRSGTRVIPPLKKEFRKRGINFARKHRH